MKKLTSLCLSLMSFLFINELRAQSFSVPSPSASQMTRYGGSSINESSGRITTSIPVYKYNAGNLSVPIGLNYIGNGVKIDQHSNWVGTNWLLDSGGVITRVVNHIADETAQNRLYFSDIPFLSDTANIAYTAGLLDGTNLNDDLRPDLFSFSFSGYSGSFYLDANGLPKLMVVDSEMKIELVTSPSDPTLRNIFVITTPDGIKYFFGGDNASESTSTVIQKPTNYDNSGGGLISISGRTANTTSRQPVGGGGTNPVSPPGSSTIDYSVIPKAITAFYLYKIVHPLGGEILLEYHDDGDQEYTMFEGDYLEKLKNDNYSEISEECSLQFFGNTDNTTIQHSVYKGKIYDRKKISRIYSLDSNYEVRFLSTSLTLDPDGNGEIPVQYDDRVLNSIEVYNNQIAEVTKKVDLEYITTDHRIFLEKVNTKNDINTNEYCSVYKMEYDDPTSLPERFSKAQDLLGYYNNQLQNITTLPHHSSPEFTGVFSNLANRALDFNYVKKGSLSKIYYPSGGYTQYEYEAPKVNALANVYQPFHITGEVVPGNSQTREFYFDTVPEGELGTTAKNYWVRLGASISSPVAFAKHAVPRLRIQLIREHDGYAAYDQTLWGVEGEYSVAGTYDIPLSGGGPNTKLVLTLLGNSLSANITVDANLAHIGYKSIDAYGIRAKRTSDYAKNGADPLVKRYYYTRIEKALTGDEDEESAVITYEPDAYFSGSFDSGCCPTIQGSSIYSYVSLSSNPFGYFFANADNQASYRYVTTSLGGDNFEQGGIENYYRVELDEDPTIEFIPENAHPKLNRFGVFLGSFTDNKSILNGVLLGTTNYKNKVGSEVVKVNETEYAYDITSIGQTTGLILSSNTRTCLLNTTRPIIAYYKNDSYDIDLTSVKNRVYTGDLPGPEETSTSYLETEKTFQYGTLQGLPIKTQAYNSEGDAYITKNYYLTPQTVNDLVGLSTNETNAYNNLMGQFRINAPIQVENYVKNDNDPVELRSTQRFTFDVFNGKTLPKTTKVSKMNLPLENGTSILKYDTNGYALESSSENGIVSSIIYGYKDKKVIAKLVGISYDDIDPLTISQLHTLANNVINTTTQQALETALDALRTSYPQAYVTTHVYNKLGQLVITKDPRGNAMKYEYDDCFRLQKVKDRDGNILKEHFYNITNNQ